MAPAPTTCVAAASNIDTPPSYPHPLAKRQRAIEGGAGSTGLYRRDGARAAHICQTGLRVRLAAPFFLIAYITPLTRLLYERHQGQD